MNISTEEFIKDTYFRSASSENNTISTISRIFIQRKEFYIRDMELRWQSAR